MPENKRSKQIEDLQKQIDGFVKKGDSTNLSRKVNGNKSPNNSPNSLPNNLLFTSNLSFNIAIELVAGTIVGVILGLFFDNLFDSKPVFLIACLTLSVAAVFRSIWKKR